MKKILFLGLLIAAAIIFSGCITSQSGLATAQKAQDSTISIPLDKISTAAKFFEYDSKGTTIRFFAVKAKDGSIKTAFDACDVCYGFGKGYRQEGDFMVCNNCGNKYPISGLGTENKNPGGCWPGFLPSKVSGNNLLIEKADLEKARGKFA